MMRRIGMYIFNDKQLAQTILCEVYKDELIVDSNQLGLNACEIESRVASPGRRIHLHIFETQSYLLWFLAK